MIYHPSVKVEFFGVPRLRAGVSETKVECPSEVISLGTLLEVLSKRFPGFGQQCIETNDSGDCKLKRSIIANIDGEAFVKSSATEIRTDQTIMILSSDAGG